MRLTIALLLASLAAALLSGCSPTDDDFVATNIIQRTVEPGMAETLTLTAGDSLSIPGDTFDEETVVVFANVFTGADGSSLYFPTASQEQEDLLSATVINTPVDKLFRRDVTLTLDILDPTDDRTIAAVVPGGTYRLHRFDFDNLRWQPWGNATAVVNSAGTQATATLPTNGFRGFIGSLAIFDGITVTGPAEDTVIRGTVRGSSGAGIATDVGLYIIVGAIKHPVAVINGRVPAISDERGDPVTVANTVDSAADGSFELELPGHLVGTIVGLEFGHEDAARGTQEAFDLLAPATPDTDVENLVVRYGVNNVISQPVQ